MSVCHEAIFKPVAEEIVVTEYSSMCHICDKSYQKLQSSMFLSKKIFTNLVSFLIHVRLYVILIRLCITS